MKRRLNTMRLQNWGEEMYLSRIRLDAANRNTLRALTAPQKFHGALESAFSGPRKRNLWRIDSLNGELYILLLSEEIPDLSGFCRQYCRTADDAQTKQYDGLLARITAGSIWHFRLTANPTVSRKANRIGQRGKVEACSIVDCSDKEPDSRLITQKEWLLTHCEKHGFRLSEESFDVTQSRWHQFYKSDRNRVSLLAVTFEGTLEVTDAELFRQALCAGIGRGKAYGLGMLTVMHI